MFGNSFQRNLPMSRRDMIRVGALGVGGVSLANVLRTESAMASQGKIVNKKSCILIWLAGGTKPHRYVRFET